MPAAVPLCPTPQQKAGQKRKRSSLESAQTVLLEPWQLLRRVALTKTKLAEDNYDLSDMEEDSSGNRIEPDRTKKQTPAWCTGYAGVVTAQAAINPDSIFGTRVPQIDLDTVFPDRLYRHRTHVKRRRGSSAKWFDDRLTQKEVAEYVAKTNQKRRWSMLQKRLFTATAKANGGCTSQA